MGSILDKISDDREQENQRLQEELARAKQAGDTQVITRIESALQHQDNKYLSGGLHGPPYFYKKQWGDL